MNHHNNTIINTYLLFANASARCTTPPYKLSLYFCILCTYAHTSRATVLYLFIYFYSSTANIHLAQLIPCHVYIKTELLTYLMFGVDKLIDKYSGILCTPQLARDKYKAYVYQAVCTSLVRVKPEDFTLNVHWFIE